MLLHLILKPPTLFWNTLENVFIGLVPCIIIWVSNPKKEPPQKYIDDMFVLSTRVSSFVPDIDWSFGGFWFAAFFLLMNPLHNQIVRQYAPTIEIFSSKVWSIIDCQIWETRSLGTLWAPTSSWRPFDWWSAIWEKLVVWTIKPILAHLNNIVGASLTFGPPTLTRCFTKWLFSVFWFLIQSPNHIVCASVIQQRVRWCVTIRAIIE